MKSLLLLSLVLVLTLTGCDPQPRRASRRKAHPTKQVQVTHLPDGRYVYRDDSGNLWLYMYIMNSTHQPTYYRSDSGTSLPRGGAWVSGSSAGLDSDELISISAQASNAPSVETAISVESSGEPYSLADLQADMTGFADQGVDTHADGMTDSPDAGGTDAGGGGSGGGGGSA